jgi:hypothetical protein
VSTYPLQQVVYDQEHWCAYYGRYITERTHVVRLGSTLCSHHDPWGVKLSGGAGFSYVTSRSGGAFGCPLFPGLPLQSHDDWFDMARNAWGTESFLRAS